MKKSFVLFLLVAVLLICCACDSGNYADITPRPDVLEGICIQRTNIDEAGNYTYFEKNLTEVDEINWFCEKIDEIKFLEIEPQKFSSADYLVVFEGKKEHKMMISGNKIIYDGLAYEITGGQLGEKIAEIYGLIEQQEVKADSKIFK